MRALVGNQDRAAVLAIWPDADCWGPVIYRRPGTPTSPNYEILSEKAEAVLGYGDTEIDAWGEAARNLAALPAANKPTPGDN